MTLKAIQATVDEWIATHRTGYFSPLEIMACLAEETGELAGGLLAGERGRQTTSELADVTFMLVCMANALDIDLDEAMTRMLERQLNARID